MLSQETIKIVKSSVPVLKTHGNEITKRFYQLLFSSHPELLNIFNHANQKQGRQQRALANAVYAAAEHIDNLSAILPTAEHIAHKHRSLGIQPEQYPIVGENLLLAIKDVLGEAATDEVMNAWAEAYQEIANVFISLEKNMYNQAEHQAGGWEGFRNFVIAKKVVETEVITSFYLVPQDGKELATFIPGQYISIKLDIPETGYTHIRQYSLSDAPRKSYYRISVKREDAVHDMPQGIVSVYLHNHVQEGDIVQISAPAGAFTLDTQTDTPVVLLSGGVGLTPLISMLNTIVETQPNRKVTFIHAAINSRFHAMKNHVQNIADTHSNVELFVCYESPTPEDKAAKNYDKAGFVDLEWLKSILPLNQRAEYYFCGPVPFMKAVYRTLTQLNVPLQSIHFEFFGPADELQDVESELQLVHS